MSVVEEVHEDGRHGHCLDLQGVMHHVMLSGPLEDSGSDEMLLSVLFSGGGALMTLEDLRVLHRFLGEYLASRLNVEHGLDWHAVSLIKDVGEIGGPAAMKVWQSLQPLVGHLIREESATPTPQEEHDVSGELPQEART